MDGLSDFGLLNSLRMIFTGFLRTTIWCRNQADDEAAVCGRIEVHNYP